MCSNFLDGVLIYWTSVLQIILGILIRATTAKIIIFLVSVKKIRSNTV